MRRLFLSFLGSGYLKPASGTWGSLAALPVALALHMVGGPALLAIAALIAYLAGVTALKTELETAENHDPGWVVIDEVVGQWIALLPVSIGAFHTGMDALRLWPGIVAAFLLFRLFDIWKPGPAGKADARGDATGVMLDDVWAGVFAAIGVVILAGIAHSGLFSGGAPQ